MKRKLVLSLLIVLTICIITGCSNNKVSSNNSNEDMKDKLIINGYDLTLDKESSCFTPNISNIFFVISGICFSMYSRT